jgi:hypothetical protein
MRKNSSKEQRESGKKSIEQVCDLRHTKQFHDSNLAVRGGGVSAQEIGGDHELCGLSKNGVSVFFL